MIQWFYGMDQTFAEIDLLNHYLSAGLGFIVQMLP